MFSMSFADSTRFADHASPASSRVPILTSYCASTPQTLGPKVHISHRGEPGIEGAQPRVTKNVSSHFISEALKRKFYEFSFFLNAGLVCGVYHLDQKYPCK